MREFVSNQKIEMNKRIAYLLFDNIYQHEKGGIKNKVRGQIIAFEKKGYHVDLVSFKKKNKLFFNKEHFLTIPSKILLFKFLIFNKIFKKLKKQPIYDFIYIRYFLSSISFIFFLRKIKKAGIKIIIELPTYPYDSEMDAQNIIERINIFLDKVTRKMLKKYVYLCVSPTYKENIFDIPTIKIENGISVEDIKVVSQKEKNIERINLIGVANLSLWHGYDRIICGLESYYKSGKQDMEVFFTIIGDGKELNNLKNLSRELDLDKYILFTGALQGSELDEYFFEADIAVASLGLHRIGLKTGSTLKASEYLARGLPIIFAYEDIAIQSTLPFVLKVPANDIPIKTSHIIDFYRGQNSTPDIIRNYASNNLDWEIQMNKIISRINY